MGTGLPLCARDMLPWPAHNAWMAVDRVAKPPASGDSGCVVPLCRSGTCRKERQAVYSESNFSLLLATYHWERVARPRSIVGYVIHGPF